MPQIADYKVITDTKFQLSSQPGGDPDRDFDFMLESGVATSHRGILFFMLTVFKGVSVQVRINGAVAETYVYHGPIIVGLHEVIAGLRQTENNIEFRIVQGVGVVEISDAVIHYQRDI